MRLLMFILSLSLVACAKKSADDSDVTTYPDPTFTQYSAATGCTQTSSGALSFLEWGTLTGAQYSCPVLSGLTCTMKISGDKEHAELVCDSGTLSTLPRSCNTYGEGWHAFLDGQEMDASSYDCGVWNHLRCFYYRGATEEEMRCLDNQLPYLDEKAFRI